MAGSYEKNEKKLMELWNDILSDDEEPVEYADNSSDDYHPSSSTDSDCSDSSDSTYKMNPIKKYKRYVSNILVITVIFCLCKYLNYEYTFMQIIAIYVTST